MNIAVILASGMGKRMGADQNKVFLTLGGKPLIFYTVMCFEKSPDIDAIVVVARDQEIDDMTHIVNWCDCTKVAHIIAGGAERQYSAEKGMQCVRTNYDDDDIVVLFHNGANPFVTSEEIAHVIAAARENGAAVVGHPTTDTIRTVSQNRFSQGVIDRSHLWNMQTPQAMKLDIADAAFAHAREHDFLGTDDVSLVEEIGGDVVIVPASQYNFKVTTPLDLLLAESVLAHTKQNT